MALIRGDLLAHFARLQAALDEVGAEAVLSMAYFSVVVRFGSRECVLYPRFVSALDGVERVTETFSQEAQRFLGWLPFKHKPFSLQTDKLAFKRFAAEQGLQTPNYWLGSTETTEATVIKKNAGSGTVRGPFAGEGFSQRLYTDEYREQYIPGKIAKICYWNGTAAALELEWKPHVIGDGASTIEELIIQRLKLQRGENTKRLPFTYDVKAVEDILSFYDRSLGSRLPRFESQIVDIRYGSQLQNMSSRQEINLPRKMPAHLEKGIVQIGQALKNIPPSLHRPNWLVVDAILDADRRFWVLGLDQAPVMHPYAYPLMVQSLYEGGKVASSIFRQNLH